MADPMRYISTRGSAPALGFADASLAGLASDGGLYVPAEMPLIEKSEISNMANQPYAEIAWRVMMPFVAGDLTSQELLSLIRKAYAAFDTPEVAPLRQLEDNIYLLELFHGPTLAFKDVALQFLGHLFDHLLQKRAQRVTIVGATSGDTGSAAIEAFKNKSNVDIFILHPKGRVSDVQRLQMTTVDAQNVHNIAIDGSFDDCQDLVKAMFADATFRNDMHLSAVNSINFARILAQIVYYMSAGSKILDKTGRAPAFCVPTGNFGNVYAGYLAKTMGLETQRLIVATNANDILHRFFENGRMQKDGVKATLSPSMDIQVSSNFERVLFDVYGRNGGQLAQTMAYFKDKGPFALDENMMAALRKVFVSGACDDAKTTTVIKRIYDKYNYIVDPHTAVGLGVAMDYAQTQKDTPIVTLATAHPAKFGAAVKNAIGIDPEMPKRLEKIMHLPERCASLPADLARVQDFVRGHAKI